MGAYGPMISLLAPARHGFVKVPSGGGRGA
jgi:hypothetical protein